MHSPKSIAHFITLSLHKNNSDTNVLGPEHNPNILMSDRRRSLPPEVGYAWNWYIQEWLPARACTRRDDKLKRDFPRIRCCFPNQDWTFDKGSNYDDMHRNEDTNVELAPEEILEDGVIIQSGAWIEQKATEALRQMMCHAHPHRERLKHLFVRARDIGRRRAHTLQSWECLASPLTSPLDSAPTRADSGINGVR